MDKNLMVTGIAIKEIEGVFCQPFQHLINERQQVISFFGLIKLPVVDTHSLSCDGSLWNQFILAIFHDRHTSFLGHNMNRAYPLVVRDKIDYPNM
jgi:hypothetical protein